MLYRPGHFCETRKEFMAKTLKIEDGTIMDELTRNGSFRGAQREIQAQALRVMMGIPTGHCKNN